MKYADLLAKFKAGFVDTADLDGVSSEDWMKVRLEAGDGILSCALTDDAMISMFADHPEDDDDDEEEDEGKKKPKKKASESKTFSYVMVTDSLIPPFNDKVEAKAWDLTEFKYRGGIILYGHNMEMDRPPIGKGTNIKKGVEMKRGKREFKALTGDVTFADRSIYPFAGMVSDLVEAKLLTNGSVGFDIVKMRAPSDEEIETQGFKPYSAIIQKASLFEFSIVPLGRDENAQRLDANGLDPLDAKLAEFAEAGVYDDTVIGEFREGRLENAGVATRCSITMPEIKYATGGVVEGVASFTSEHGPESFVPLPGGKTIPVTLQPQTLGLVTQTGTTTNDSTFVLYDQSVQCIPQPTNGKVQQIGALYDQSARDDIASLKSELAALRAEIERLTRTRDEELYELLMGDDADQGTPEVDGPHGSGEPEDALFSAANELGY